MFRHLRRVRAAIAQTQQAAMDYRVQRLDAAIQHLGKAGGLRDVFDRHASFAQRFGRAAGGQYLDTLLRQEKAELRQPGLVGHADQGAGDFY